MSFNVINSTIWEQIGTKNLPVMWRPHYNKLHLTEDLMCESNYKIKWLHTKYNCGYYYVRANSDQSELSLSGKYIPQLNMKKYLTLSRASKYNLLSQKLPEIRILKILFSTQECISVEGPPPAS